MDWKSFFIGFVSCWVLTFVIVIIGVVIGKFIKSGWKDFDSFNTPE
jgi:uncharacterized membrane protein YraQ (UPF0718 family)